ncbi:hypothetical protein SISNIDRAFT_464771 [Sistotremastrum niveocremeum HHB9708]|uniref:Uncharacterized protein n=1 Tax=Sistotremastrum niveocremeum HHB9708 TaxID=1314777 RepID=A0A164WJX7_9AGAM|nr:hypothetical protein SISNIDRAFT_464771 [Sistotremastrum niveocremeum HHB9708]
MIRRENLVTQKIRSRREQTDDEEESFTKQGQTPKGKSPEYYILNSAALWSSPSGSFVLWRFPGSRFLIRILVVDGVTAKVPELMMDGRPGAEFSLIYRQVECDHCDDLLCIKHFVSTCLNAYQNIDDGPVTWDSFEISDPPSFVNKHRATRFLVFVPPDEGSQDRSVYLGPFRSLWPSTPSTLFLVQMTLHSSKLPPRIISAIYHDRVFDMPALRPHDAFTSSFCIDTKYYTVNFLCESHGYAKTSLVVNSRGSEADVWIIWRATCDLLTIA